MTRWLAHHTCASTPAASGCASSARGARGARRLDRSCQGCAPVVAHGSSSRYPRAPARAARRIDAGARSPAGALRSLFDAVSARTCTVPPSAQSRPPSPSRHGWPWCRDTRTEEARPMTQDPSEPLAIVAGAALGRGPGAGRPEGVQLRGLLRALRGGPAHQHGRRGHLDGEQPLRHPDPLRDDHAATTARSSAPPTTSRGWRSRGPSRTTAAPSCSRSATGCRSTTATSSPPRTSPSACSGC
jgi:hypothetical protein